jgi:hypothetical protein
MRSEVVEDIPTIGEFVPGYEVSAWYGVGAPKGTPAEIVHKLNREINAGLANFKLNARIADLGGTVFTNPAPSPTHSARDAPVWQQSMYMRTSLCSSRAIRCLT